jgi:hypothetical protein
MCGVKLVVSMWPSERDGDTEMVKVMGWKLEDAILKEERKKESAFK